MLKAQSWQIFLAIFLPLVISINTVDYWLSISFGILSNSILFAWFLLIGKNLNEQLSDNEKRSDTFFIINCFYLILFLSASLILDDDNKGEMPPIVFVMVCYFLFAFLYVVYFTSQSFLLIQRIKTEKRDQLSFQQVFLSFMIFIVGIWVIQPKLNQFSEA